MTPSQTIVLAIPIFLLLMGAEFLIGKRRGRNTYRLNDAFSSIALGMLNQTTLVFAPLLKVGIYTAVFSSLAWWPDARLWTSPLGWLLALVLYDFLYYWNHRLGHTVGVLWAAHVVHHQSQDYNLSTALRQPSTYPLLGWVFYLPMAVLGVPPWVFAVVALIDLLYQFWIHTEQVGSLGRFDRWFASPSNHRVHHAVNDRYLDKNYGGILMLWDHLFGTFEPEDAQERCVYGTRSPLNSWDPLWANAEVYWALAKDSWSTRRWSDKLRVWLKPPGWRPADVAERDPRPAFDMSRLPIFAPAISRSTTWFAAIQLSALVVGTAVFLWHADSRPLTFNLLGFLVMAVCMWSLGAVLQNRISILEALMLACGALSTVTSATDWTTAHLIFKPLTMLVAITLVAQTLVRSTDRPARAPWHWLLMALTAALAGDVFLMLNGFFIQGLAAFLLTHLAYLMVLSHGVGWLPSGRALWAAAATGCCVYSVLWFGGLPPALRTAVAAYVLAIVLMAAQAIGRALVLRDGPSRLVALGAVCFVLSDMALAINRFVMPLPLSAVWVLGSYYAAQTLIVAGLLRSHTLSGDKPPGATPGLAWLNR